jgi:Ca2+-binding EF-hand superfamily protein
MRRMVGKAAGMVALLALACAAAGCRRHGHGAVPPVAAGTHAAVLADESAPRDSITFNARFTTLDDDDDGRIDFGEYAASATGKFVTMDIDGNGLVTPAEMDARRAALGRMTKVASADVIRPVDSDGDGMLAQWENEAIARREFDALDRDHDGFITRDEARAQPQAFEDP